jgi:hypothetical protein
MVTFPAATPVTFPVAETVAIEAFDEDQVTTRSVSNAPLAARTEACNCNPAPPTETVPLGGLTTTVDTGVRTMTVAVAVFPPAVADTVVCPSVMPVTVPVCETEAMLGPAMVQLNWRPVSAVPAAERAVAVNCPEPVGSMVRVAGEISTVAMGSGSVPPPPQDNIAGSRRSAIRRALEALNGRMYEEGSAVVQRRRK